MLTSGSVLRYSLPGWPTFAGGSTASTYASPGLPWQDMDDWEPDSLVATATIRSLQSEIQDFLKSYSDGWDGPGSKGPTRVGEQAINCVLNRIPSGLPLPKTMLSPSGELGLFWDFGHGGYADLGADTDGALSFFSRDIHGVEHFEEMQDSDLGAAWFWARLGPLRVTEETVV